MRSLSCAPSLISVDDLGHEIRLTALGKRANYITYAINKLTGRSSHDATEATKQQPAAEAATETKAAESTTAIAAPAPATASATRGVRRITLCAMGRAMDRAVHVAEILKRRVGGLHQLTRLESKEVEDEYEPTEEGLRRSGGRL